MLELNESSNVALEKTWSLVFRKKLRVRRCLVLPRSLFVVSCD